MITCSDLRETVTRPRWLQIPMSRLVVNPWDVTQPAAYPTPREFAWALPLDLGYHYGEVPIRLPVFWSWRPWEPHLKCIPNLEACEHSLDGISWHPTGLSIGMIEQGMKLTISGEANYGEAAAEVTVDLDKTPCLNLMSGDTDASWAVKVNAGGEDSLIVRDSNRQGWFIADIKAATGWSGKKTFTLKLFAVGQPGTSVCLSGLKFVSSDGPTSAETSWSPDRIVQTTEFERFDAAYEITTCLPDEDTVAQLLRVDKPGHGRVILKGQFPEGRAIVSEDKRTIAITSDRVHAVIAFSQTPRIAALSPGHAHDGKWIQWAVTFDELEQGTEIVTAATFSATPDGADQSAKKALSYANPDALRKALAAREAAWNEWLSKVPMPRDFTLHYLTDRNVTAEQLERMYYKAWVFTIGNSLPAQPENSYPYPQITCGKPSLWAEGHEKAAPSAQWESFVAMQLMVWIDPDLAWSSFEGMMSLVDDEGTLGGEGLPSRHVQTAWVLYALTGDKKRLRRVYAPMKRMLQWKAADPRWIYKGLTPPGLKDAEFVVHALMDMSWAIRICKVLDMPKEAAHWRKQIDGLRESYWNWFWETPGGPPNYTYHEELGRRSGDRHSWSLTGLCLPGSILGEPQKQSLLTLFRSMVDDSVPFLIKGLNKFPQVNYAMVGLWIYGEPDEVARMAEASMTAVTMAGEFAECYGDTFPAYTWGVTPSMFGAASMIDGALWHNGILIGDGLPIIVHTPNAVGVDNIPLRRGTLNVRFDGDEVELSSEESRSIALPVGQQFTFDQVLGR